MRIKRMVKLPKTVLYTRSGILFGLPREGNYDTGYHTISLEDITLRARYRIQKASCCGFCHRSSVEQSKSQGQRMEWWLSGAGEGGFQGVAVQWRWRFGFAI